MGGTGGAVGGLDARSLWCVSGAARTQSIAPLTCRASRRAAAMLATQPHRRSWSCWKRRASRCLGGHAPQHGGRFMGPALVTALDAWRCPRQPCVTPHCVQCSRNPAPCCCRCCCCLSQGAHCHVTAPTSCRAPLLRRTAALPLCRRCHWRRTRCRHCCSCSATPCPRWASPRSHAPSPQPAESRMRALGGSAA